MTFPSEFSARFTNRGLLYSNEHTSVWRVADARGRSYALKSVSIDWCPSQEVLDVLQEIRHLNVVAPVECRTSNGRHYQLLHYFQEGSLDSLLEREKALPIDACEALIRQLHAVLRALHTLAGNRYLIHGDIKPSNILLRYNSQGRRQYFLSDFGVSVLMDDTSSRRGNRIRQRYTLRYAAPERVGGGTLTAAADYWSLGMLLLECLTGRHPIEPDKKPEVVRTFLSSNWQPKFDDDRVDYQWRALFGGLFDRNPLTRWGYREIDRWIARDPGIISDGLIKAGGTIRRPFMVGDTPVYSGKDLAKALLQHWQGFR